LTSLRKATSDGGLSPSLPCEFYFLVVMGVRPSFSETTRWKYKSPIWAGAFLDRWCHRAMRSRLEPIKKVARMLGNHEEPLLNWFRAKDELSSGAVEGLNNKL
jgi:transposase